MIVTLVPAIAFAGETQAAAVTYTDLAATHWSKRYIDTLSDRGILAGYPDGSFQPDALVTRAEFAKMVVLYMGAPMPATFGAPFSDVSENHWAKEVIAAGKSTEIIGGYPGGVFKPDANITRAEITKIVVAAWPKVAKFKASSIQTVFPDIGGHWALNDITTLRDLGVADGYPDGMFRPDRNATRAEAAKLLYLLITSTTQTTSGGSSSGGGTGPSPQPEPEPQPDDACEVIRPNEAEGSFGSQGGSLVVDKPGSPIDGARVDIPAGAIDPGVTMTIALSYEDTLPGQIDDEYVAPASGAVTLSKDVCCNFKLPVTITMPWTGENLEYQDLPSVFYWSPEYEEYKAVGVKDIDAWAGPTSIAAAIYETPESTISFATVHSGTYAALGVYGLAYEIIEMSSGDVDTQFDPEDDGFNIADPGVNIVPGGSSIGMANYSSWYYANKKSISGNILNGRYNDDDTLELISRAFLGSSNMWAYNWTQFDYNLNDYETGYQLIQTMQITGDPQTLIMHESLDSDDPNTGKVVVVYSYETGEGNWFNLYDCDKPNDSYFIGWDWFYGFESYDEMYNDYKFEAISSSVNPSQYETLYDGVENEWPAADFGTITLTSPDTDTLSYQDMVVTGTVTGGKKAPKYLVYNHYNGGSYWDAPNRVHGLASEVIALGPDGSFSFTISKLEAIGDNTIMMYASDTACATVRRCPQPYAAFKELNVNMSD